MNTKYINLLHNSYMPSIASIVVGIAVLLSPGIVAAQDFEGSQFCQNCHEKKFSDWSASGHPYKLMKSEEARNRPIPLPGGFAWDDVSYVIGGYKWKSRYIDTDGYIITVTEDEDGNNVDGVNQYNYLTGTWSNYHAGEVDKPYNCGTCHTTNWVANPDPTNLDGNQDNLPGMHGTFDAGGVHCEQCHGNGMTMEIDDSAAMCGTCHIRGEADTIPASGGFIRHHEQYNEHLAGAHASFKCVDCHNPHQRGEFSIWEDGESDDYPLGNSTGAQCGVNCHADKMESFAKTSMYDYGVECKDCHMPFATKSAQALGPNQGDLQTHIFYIDTDPTANMFTEDGGLVVLDDNGKAAVTMDFACKRCHLTADINELAKYAKNFHNPTLDEIGLNPGLTGHWWGGSSHDGEGFQFDFSYNNQNELVVIASFYTYDNMGNQTWLLATGPITDGATSVDVEVFITEGRMWGDDYDPTEGSTPQWGTGTFTFPSCTAGSFTLSPNTAYQDLGFTDIGYDLNREILTPGIACPTFVNNTQ